MVNTLELRGIEIQTFLREIEKSFLQVLNNCVPARERSYPVAGYDRGHRQLDIPMTPTIRTPILKPSS